MNQGSPAAPRGRPRPGTERALCSGSPSPSAGRPASAPCWAQILTLGAQHTPTSPKGALLLAVYSLGLGLPFLLAALFTGALLARLKALGRAGRNLQRAAGGLLLAMGLLMVTGQLERLAYWMLETFPALGRIG